MAGDAETGVTIHRTTPELDAGPIGARRSRSSRTTTRARSTRRDRPVAVELLEDVLAGPRLPQPEEGVTYAEKITAPDRELDWSRPPEEIVNRVRALSPHIGARAVLEGRPVIVWQARLADGRAEPVEVQPEGGRRMAYDAFLRGLR